MSFSLVNGRRLEPAFHHDATSPEYPAIKSYLLLRQVAQVVAEESDRQLVGWGLSLSRYQILRLLRYREPAPLTWLSEGHFSSNANMTRLIDRMERDGLVKRVTDPKDRRVIRVRLTEKGIELHDAAVGPHRKFIAELMAGLDQQSHEALSELLQTLGEHLQNLETNKA